MDVFRISGWASERDRTGVGSIIVQFLAVRRVVVCCLKWPLRSALDLQQTSRCVIL